MFYQLVLITTLGVVTPVAIFPDRDACIMEQAYIHKSPQYSTACLPAQSPEQVEVSIRQMMQLLRIMKQEIKEIDNGITKTTP